MRTSRCRNLIETGSLSNENVDYHSVISFVALLDIHPLSCENGMEGLLRIILISMQDHNA